ncbi:MAG: hypothetical protein EON90_04080 [Brevundimonas sp.]|nr:MAG: hypothetical protein EON90_04080 [Brevundimonas sp.]
MTDWVKASNPTAPIINETEATAAARASAIAIFIGVLWGVVTTAWLLTSGGAVMEAAMAEAAAQNPDAATMPGMAGMMTSFAIGMSVAMVVIQLILGLVQWFKPNVVIPIIFTILIVYGLGSTALGLMMAGSTPSAATGPMWTVAGGFIVMIIELILHIAGIRGGNALGKFRREAETY